MTYESAAVVLLVARCTVDPELTDPDAVTITAPDGDAVVLRGTPDELRELADSIRALADEIEDS